MKQKNLILIAVAVVCGLVAAFLATQMSAKGGKEKTVEMVKIPVANRDIPIGTRFTEKDIETYFKLADFPKDTVPANCVQKPEELVGKRMTRQIAMGNMISQQDVNPTGFLEPPPGTLLMTVPITIDQAAAGFAIPGTRVMVIASKKSAKKNAEIVFPLLLDSLVLAVNTNPGAPVVQSSEGSQAATTGFQQVSMISLAVTPDESVILTMAANTAQLRMGLPSMNDKEKAAIMDGYKTLVPTKEEILRIFADKWEDEKPSGDGKPVAPAVEFAKVSVPAEPIEVGTKITQEVIDLKFKTIDFPKDNLPAGIAVEEKDFTGKYTTAELVPGFPVSQGYLSKTAPKPPENPVAATNSVAGAKGEASVADYEAAKSKDYVDNEPKPRVIEYAYVTIYTPKGKVVHQYEKTPKGNVFVKEIVPGLDDEKVPAGK